MVRPLPDDPLDALRRRIEATQEAVERLAQETASAREHFSASGGEDPGEGDGPPRSGETATDELRALVDLFEMVRGLLPGDLQAQLTELIRQLLLLVRAILDWWIERIGRPAAAAEPAVVQDIEVR